MGTNETMIQRITNYTQPFIDSVKDGTIDIGELPMDSVELYIEEVPNANGNIISEDLEGNSVREYLFALVVGFQYDEVIKKNIQECSLFEQFQNWIEKQNIDEHFPQLMQGLASSSVKVKTTSFLEYDSKNNDYAKYQMQCQLIYEKEII